MTGTGNGIVGQSPGQFSTRVLLRASTSRLFLIRLPMAAEP